MHTHYYHSPFSEKSSFSEKNKALLLSFALAELFTCSSSEIDHWARGDIQEKRNDAPLNRFIEHTSLLLKAFPSFLTPLIEIKEKTAHLLYCLQKSICFCPKERLKELFHLLDPLMQECSNDANFLYFLLSRQSDMDLLLDSSYLPSFLKELYPDFSELDTHLCDYFHKRGFTRLLPEISLFIEKIQFKDPL